MNHRLIRITLILAVFCLAWTTMLWAQEEEQETRIEQKEVPQAVLDAFHKAYPGAEKITFSREEENGQTKYEISFTVKGKKKEVSYAPDGKVLEVEEEIGIDEIPRTIIDLIKSHTTAFKILKAEKITEGDFEGYELKFEYTRKGKTRVREVLFDAQGNKVQQPERGNSENERD